MARPDDSTGGPYSDDDRWLVIDGRRWRRTDPHLPEDLVARLKSHLGRGRSGVGAAKKRGDDEAVAAARRIVGLAKLGLGERGAYWWNAARADRIAQAEHTLAELDDLTSP